MRLLKHVVAWAANYSHEMLLSMHISALMGQGFIDSNMTTSALCGCREQSFLVKRCRRQRKREK